MHTKITIVYSKVLCPYVLMRHVLFYLDKVQYPYVRNRLLRAERFVRNGQNSLLGLNVDLVQTYIRLVVR